MRSRKYGKIINISSISGRLGFPGYGPYAASKFAVEGFSESLRLEMLPYGVYVSLVEPGAYKTAIWSKGFDYITMRARKDSPYQEPLAAILAYSNNVANNASDPQDVARTVVRIAQARYPKLRYVLGKGAWTAIWGKALLPWKWFEQIVLRQLRK
ncbi:putative oxidoreductase SadH [compost metagenome]